MTEDDGLHAVELQAGSQKHQELEESEGLCRQIALYLVLSIMLALVEV